jgi:hypothetical protein
MEIGNAISTIINGFFTFSIPHQHCSVVAVAPTTGVARTPSIWTVAVYESNENNQVQILT